MDLGSRHAALFLLLLLGTFQVNLHFSPIHITFFLNLVHSFASRSFLSNGPYHNQNYKSASPKSKRIHLVNAGLGR